MVPSLSTAAAAGLVASATRQRRSAVEAERVALSPSSTNAELRAALLRAAHQLDTHAYLTEVAAELCGPPSGPRE